MRLPRGPIRAMPQFGWPLWRERFWLPSVLQPLATVALFSACAFSGGHQLSARVTRCKNKLRLRGLSRERSVLRRVPLFAPPLCSCTSLPAEAHGGAATLARRRYGCNRCRRAAGPRRRQRCGAPAPSPPLPRERAKTAQARAHGQAQGRGRVLCEEEEGKN